jgi:kynurenine 3-monooxygenase
MLGDAAHAMVPFYGQGLNCGFEDCITLERFLDMYPDDRAMAFHEYTRLRHPDVIAICDLAMYNYVEMRASVISRRFLLRRQLEIVLQRWLPYYFISLYSMISFTQIPYSQAVHRWQRQNFIVNILIVVFGLLILAGGLYLFNRLLRKAFV